MTNEFEIRGDSAVIFLNRRNGETIEALIDIDDLARAQEHPLKWCAVLHRTTPGVYVHGSYRKPNGKGTGVYLHRWIVRAQKGMEVHHKNGNPLDNRRSNLEVVTRAIHNQLHRGVAHLFTSGDLDERIDRARRALDTRDLKVDVYWNRQKNRWCARLRGNGERVYIGNFKTRDEVDNAVARVMA